MEGLCKEEGSIERMIFVCELIPKREREREEGKEGVRVDRHIRS